MAEATPGDDRALTELEVGRRFEALTYEVLTTFLRLAPDRVDTAILETQRRVCELFGLQLSVLWQWAAASPRFQTITHLYRPLGGPPVPDRIDAEEMYPWALREVLAHREVAISSTRELPAAAAQDRAMQEHFGVKSWVTFPLVTGGGPTLGAVSFADMQEERAWPDELRRRLRFVAGIFAAALDRKRADLEVREGEERLQLAAESAGIGLWEMDAETSGFWLTDVARELSGLDGALEVTLDGVLGAIDPEDRDEVLTAIEGARKTGELTRVEYRVATPGRGVRWLASSGRFHPGDSRGPAALRGVTTDITERRRSEESLRDLSQRLLQAHEAERALLARELHDDVSQRLAVLAIEVGRLEQSLTAPDHRTEMTSVRESLVRLSEDIHTLSYQLHPSVLEELGIVEALEAECERFRRQNAMPIRANLAPVDRGLALEEALCLFRVAQHALRNVLLHSAATAVNLVLRPLDGGFMLKVADNGVGFDVAAQRERRSLGLASMRERVRLVGGSIDIETEPGVGTSVSAWVPGRGGDT